MSLNFSDEIREDCLIAVSGQGDSYNKLSGQRIAITGGTGFLGTWIAETVAALNDKYRLGIILDLYSRYAKDWAKKRPHLASREDINVHNQDVRSPFDFHQETTFVVHAAGTPDNRVHSSDPLRVYQTIVYGTHNALDAAAKLPALKRFLNVSSGLVYGSGPFSEALSESTFFPIEAGQVHSVYSDAKRAAESLCAVYRSQFRLPISTSRPFTFIGPYQELDRPWAINNFIRDALKGNEIRLHGDGSTSRSYLYGSDVAWWVLSALVNGVDGRAYNIGSAESITHKALAEAVAGIVKPSPRILLRTLLASQLRRHDFFPDVSRIKQELHVRETCPLLKAIEKTIRWYSLK